MSKRVTFTRKELLDMIDHHLKDGAEKTAAYQVEHSFGGGSAFAAGYYEQALRQIRSFMESRYEA